MEISEIKRIVEAMLFVADQPVSAAMIKSVLGEAAEGYDVEDLIKKVGEDYRTRNAPVELRFIAGGWQMATCKEFNPWIRKLYKEKTTLRLSNSALETLSVVAYKQPMTRSEIEEIRGVEVSGVIETLLERRLIKVVGRKETIGRPLLYGTTQEFLRHFGLAHLSELPSLDEMMPPEEPTEVTAAADEGEDEVSSGDDASSPFDDVLGTDVAQENACFEDDAADGSTGSDTASNHEPEKG